MKELTLSTALGHATTARIVVRGHDLVEHVMGHMTFTETLYLLITGRRPTAAALRLCRAPAGWWLSSTRNAKPISPGRWRS